MHSMKGMAFRVVVLTVLALSLRAGAAEWQAEVGCRELRCRRGEGESINMTYAPELIHPKDGGYVFGAAPPSATHHGQCDGQTQLGSALRTVNCTGHGVYEIEADWLFGGPTASGWFSMCAADSKCDKMQFLFSFNNGAVRKPGVTVTWNNAKSMDRSVCPDTYGHLVCGRHVLAPYAGTKKFTIHWLGTELRFYIDERLVFNTTNIAEPAECAQAHVILRPQCFTPLQTAATWFVRRMRVPPVSNSTALPV
jgi:hypothetical protein